jgi:predicted metallopeptidase
MKLNRPVRHAFAVDFSFIIFVESNYRATCDEVLKLIIHDILQLFHHESKSVVPHNNVV